MSTANRLEQKLTRAYVIALMVVACLAACAFLAVRAAHQAAERHAQALTLMADHSAGASAVAQLFARLSADPADAIALRALAEARRDIAVDLAALAALPDPRAVALFAGPDGAVARHGATLLAQIDATLIDPRAASRPEQLSGRIELAAQRAPGAMSAALGRYAALIAEDARIARRRAEAFVFACFAVLALEWLFIYRPIVGVARRRFEALKDAGEELRRAGHVDTLTGLPNRLAFRDRIAERLLARQPVAVLHFDLDRFNELNCTLGHPAGDAVLRQTARALISAAPKDALVARVGGDEFAILLKDGGDAGALAEKVEAIRCAVRERFDKDGVEWLLSASAGVVRSADLFPETSGDAVTETEPGGAPADQVLMASDLALFRAKTSGRDRSEMFTPALCENLSARRMLGAELKQAVREGDFEPHLQPQVGLDGQTLIGFEALARWRRRGHGVVAPQGFIQVAEEIGIVDRIDMVIMEKVGAEIAAWRAAGLPAPPVSVNVSSRRLTQTPLAADVGAMLERWRLPAQALAIEILESAMLDQLPAQAERNLDHLRRLGVRLELDDFGTGHASLANLRRLRPHRIKIDRSMIDRVVEDAEQRAIVRGIVDLSAILGVEALAEGVETPEQFDILRGLGCDSFQGFLFGRPEPLEHIRARLELHAGPASETQLDDAMAATGAPDLKSA